MPVFKKNEVETPVFGTGYGTHNRGKNNLGCIYRNETLVEQI